MQPKQKQRSEFLRGEPFFLSFFQTFQAEGRHLGDDSCSVWNVALVALVSDEWLIGEGHNPNLSVLLELRKSFQHKLSPLEQSSVKAIARGLGVLFLGELSLGEQEAQPCTLLVGAEGTSWGWGRALFSLLIFLMEVVPSKHAQLPPAVAAALPTRSDAQPGCPADPTLSPCVLPCRVLGADATPRRPCGAHLLAPASGGLYWHSGQRGLAVANQGGLKVCSLNRNKTSIGHFALARRVLSLYRQDFYFSSAALLQRK